ncbi:anaerobic C4-dicarboxylate transporter [Dongshaea marina]|uniref:anaerobic C4-dicarboxylate transporter n=1 Tax=Dongshaea marina TaxID=2047966 RepID=UPI000D3E8B67|nr:anaerobic C4-dicarboxylate transporter [Dongshaea marina]
MFGLEFVIVLFAIFLGARLGSIGIGFAGGLGVLILTFVMGLKPGSIPVDVILIIMSVIGAIAAMQTAGGMDYLVKLAEHILRKHPRWITFLAPCVTYVMTLLAGTGHTAYSTLPVIVEVAKEQKIRPSRPLSIAVIASQIAITASPISAAVVIFSGLLKPMGVDYLQLLMIAIPTTFAACMCAAFVCNFLGKPLEKDPVYQQRLAEGLVTYKKMSEIKIKPHAKRSVLIFLLAIVAVVIYATSISDMVGLIKHPPMPRNEAIMIFMLSAATLITFLCKLEAPLITEASTFRSGMSACVCVLGVAWLGDTLISNHILEIKEFSGELLHMHAWLLAVILFFASTLLYSQAATTQALMPAALMLGVSPVAAIASFCAVSALFILPTYPTLLAATEMDDTGSTRIGRWVFNHPFLIPGTLTIALAVFFGFLLGPVVL